VSNQTWNAYREWVERRLASMEERDVEIGDGEDAPLHTTVYAETGDDADEFLRVLRSNGVKISTRSVEASGGVDRLVQRAESFVDERKRISRYGYEVKGENWGLYGRDWVWQGESFFIPKATSDADARKLLAARGVGEDGEPVKRAAPKPSATGSLRGTEARRAPFVKGTSAKRKEFQRKTGIPIPPAWTNVYVTSDHKNSDVWAYGNDVKGRKQTLYNPAYTKAQSQVKFDRVTALGPYLADLDAKLKREAKRDDTAAATLVIRTTGMRPSSERETGGDVKAYGATTLLAKHVKLGPAGSDSVTFDFIGKKGVKNHYTVTDPTLYGVLKTRKNNRNANDQLFPEATPDKVNKYIQSVAGGDFMAKDLRTTLGSAHAMNKVHTMKAHPTSMAEYRRMRKEVGEHVAYYLGNNANQALTSYIDPVIFEAWKQSMEKHGIWKD
jgi:DNA topoisomerase I